ncbi:glycine cleavage system protein GcvH [Microbacterium sp. NPDC055910]|uniref:glycine cleavage system protein GcvH n=1 Tax=Microbacterium sp. NPDC055910 TaxID=3345659 RepID=UPI0035D60AD7
MTDINSLQYTAEHEWIAFADPSTGSGQVPADAVIATVGITDYAAEKLGDVVFVELPDAGSAVEAGTIVGEIESTKSVGELYAPLTGEVVEVNQAVIDDPSLVNSDPYGAAWLLKIRVDATVAEGLLDRDAYVALTGGDA